MLFCFVIDLFFSREDTTNLPNSSLDCQPEMESYYFKCCYGKISHREKKTRMERKFWLIMSDDPSPFRQGETKHSGSHHDSKSVWQRVCLHLAGAMKQRELVSSL